MLSVKKRLTHPAQSVESQASETAGFQSLDEAGGNVCAVQRSAEE
jgi:hypothetical protein